MNCRSSLVGFAADIWFDTRSIQYKMWLIVHDALTNYSVKYSRAYSVSACTVA